MRGETLAVNYLRKKGYLILQRNYRSPFGEIDIIAKFKNRLVFLEVKYRTSSEYGEPYEAVNYLKVAKLKRLIAYYLEVEKQDLEPLFEVVSITEVDGKVNIDHFEDILF